MKKLLNSILQQQLKTNVNKFLLDVEEKNCGSCNKTTNHILTGKFWTCVCCGQQIVKQPKQNFWQRLIKRIKWKNTH